MSVFFQRLERTILARSVGIASLGQQIKAGDGREALLGALNDKVQLGIDEVWHTYASALHIARMVSHSTRVQSTRCSRDSPRLNIPPTKES